MFVSSLRARAARRSTLAVVASATMAFGAAEPIASTGTALKGGPWISVETPVNPYDPSARGALFVVHTFRHGNPMDMAMTGRAEGLVDGQRRSVAFTPAKGSGTGTYVVRKQWEAKGIWTVVVTATPSDHGPGEQLQALVELGADGDVGRVTVPRNGQGAFRAVADAEIEHGLRQRASAPVAVGAR
jgi:hypothetical protein